MTREHGICQEAGQHYFACLEKDWSSIPGPVLEHLNTCQYCQEQMGCLCAEIKKADGTQKSTKDLLPLHYHLMNKWVCCDHVKPFLPILAMDRQDISAETPVTAHIERCSDCANDFKDILHFNLSQSQLDAAARFLSGESVDVLDDQPELKSVLERIHARQASSVAVRASVKPQPELAMDGQVVLEIEQAERLEPSGSTHSVETAAASSTIPRRHFMSRVISTAALLVLAAYLLLQIQPATVKGLGLKDVYAAMEQVANVCIQTMVPERAQPVQTVWISNSLQTVYSREEGREVLWDMKSQVSETMQIPWGLLPFRKISEIPAGYDWTPIESIRQLAGKPVAVYDYTWQDGTANFNVQRKWRGYLDPETKLPHRIEWWVKLPGREFEMVTTQLVSFPTDQQIEAVIEQAKSRQLTPAP